MNKNIPKMVACHSCSHCLGLTVINVITAYKADGKIIDVDEIAAYKCDIFDLVSEDDECFEFQPNKEITYFPTEWVAQ